MYKDDTDRWMQVEVLRSGDKILGFIAIHRGSKEHPAFGATRIARYEDIRDGLDDALNLASLMSHKAALADIPYGGGKGVIFWSPELDDANGRKSLLDRYLETVNKLGGRFITGSDAGLTKADVEYMRTRSPHIVGVSVDPTEWTAHGLRAAIGVALMHAFGSAAIEERTFAIRGLGKVGTEILKLLNSSARGIVAADIDPKRVEEVRRHFPKVRIVSPEEVIFEHVDVLIPCALGGVITEENAEKIPARVIVGSANNQLVSVRAGDILHRRGILYAPDYVVNAGGLISVVHEYERSSARGDTTNDIDANVLAITRRLDDIFHESKAKNIPPHRVADEIAKERIDSLYPLPPLNA